MEFRIPPQHAEPLRQELYALVESGLLVEQKDLLGVEPDATKRPGTPRKHYICLHAVQ